MKKIVQRARILLIAIMLSRVIYVHAMELSGISYKQDRNVLSASITRDGVTTMVTKDIATGKTTQQLFCQQDGNQYMNIPLDIDVVQQLLNYIDRVSGAVIVLKDVRSNSIVASINCGYIRTFLRKYLHTGEAILFAINYGECGFPEIKADAAVVERLLKCVDAKIMQDGL